MTQTSRFSERMVPGVSGEHLYAEHIERYIHASRFVNGMDVLDIACGVGYGSQRLAEAGAKTVTGIDLSETALSCAREQYGGDSLRFLIGDAQNLAEIADRSFDVLVSFETIEHLPDINKYLVEMHRVLRPGGTFLCSTPDSRLCSLLRIFRGRPSNPHHVREYTRSQFLAVLGQQFDLVECLGQQYVGELPSFWPIQVLLKGLATVFRGTPIQRSIHRIYKIDNDFVVRPPPTKRSVARFWLARCVKR